MEQPDNDLILRFNQGDTEAFTAIYNDYHLTLYHFVQKFIHKREDAEDITAEIFVKLWKLHPNFNSIKNIEAFLYITGRNACLDFLRYIQRRDEHKKKILDVLFQSPVEGTIEDIKTEVLIAIYKEVEKLPRSCRNVFKMAYFEGLTNSEIAEFLQINNQSVRNAKQRAIKLLRLALLNKNLLLNIVAGFCYYFLDLPG